MKSWEDGRENAILKKTMAFAIRIVQMTRYLNENREYVISKQVLRSGTAIGALVREAQYGESVKDFIHKLSIAIKEANETAYWIELLFGSGMIGPNAYASIYKDNLELLRILTAILNTTKKNNLRTKKT